MPLPPKATHATRVRSIGVELEDGRSLETAAGDGDRDGEGPAAQASRHEALRHRDVAALTPAERVEINRLFELLAPRVGQRRTRRYRPSNRGPVDLSRTVREVLRHGGEPAELAHRQRRRKPRPLVLLIDVSGSMEPYADALLRFAHAAVRSAPVRTEVFTLGTRLTRVTRELRRRNADNALAAAGRAIPDWSGGTRLGDMIKAFLDLWGSAAWPAAPSWCSAPTAGNAVTRPCWVSSWPAWPAGPLGHLGKSAQGPRRVRAVDRRHGGRPAAHRRAGRRAQLRRPSAAGERDRLGVSDGRRLGSEL